VVCLQQLALLLVSPMLHLAAARLHTLERMEQ
jgi:hypothetical protein